MALKRLGFRNFVAVLVLGGAFVGLTSSWARAQNPDEPELGPSGQLISGKSDFREYCQQCHGPTGIGNGPVAPALKKKPANLTLLSKNNGGVFPAEEVYNFIDGSKTAEGHGTREMPIWGSAFMSRQASHAGTGGPPLSEEQVKKKIERLVAYVKTLQVQ
ncbi:MAG: cytochrome c [Deltaproteobacteria bacterium]|nr:cytochrome c [Deltaproteobacteria bacterium]